MTIFFEQKKRKQALDKTFYRKVQKGLTRYLNTKPGSLFRSPSKGSLNAYIEISKIISELSLTNDTSGILDVTGLYNALKMHEPTMGKTLRSCLAFYEATSSRYDEAKNICSIIIKRINAHRDNTPNDDPHAALLELLNRYAELDAVLVETCPYEYGNGFISKYETTLK